MPPSTRLSWEGSSWADPTGLPSPSPVWYVFIVSHPVHHQWFLELVLDTFTVWASCNVTACFCFLSPSHCHQLTTWKIWFACFYGCTNLVMGAHQIQFLCQCLITTIGYIQSFFFLAQNGPLVDDYTQQIALSVGHTVRTGRYKWKIILRKGFFS